MAAPTRLRLRPNRVSRTKVPLGTRAHHLSNLVAQQERPFLPAIRLCASSSQGTDYSHAKDDDAEFCAIRDLVAMCCWIYPECQSRNPSCLHGSPILAEVLAAADNILPLQHTHGTTASKLSCLTRSQGSMKGPRLPFSHSIYQAQSSRTATTLLIHDRICVVKQSSIIMIRPMATLSPCLGILQQPIPQPL